MATQGKPIPAETIARLHRLRALGCTLAEAARRVGVSIPTARKYLRPPPPAVPPAVAA